MYSLNIGTGSTSKFTRPEPESTSRYFLTFENGFMYLNYNESDIVNRPIPFLKKPPLGIIEKGTETLFLFDDDLGCVYTVLCFNQTDFSKEFRRGNQEMKFRAFGTPFEEFFRCDYKFSAEGEQKWKLCNIGTIPDDAEINKCCDSNGGSSAKVLKFFLIIAIFIAI